MQLVDQIGHKLSIHSTPKRIVSTVPSQTELLYYFGMGNQVVGRTRFCVHPKQQIKRVKDIGGTKQLKLDVIADLEPDIIIANKEENEKAQILALQKHYPVYTSDIVSIDSSLKMITDVAAICGKQVEGTELVTKINHGFSELPKFEGSVAYLIWYRPYMAAATNTFIDQILRHLGFSNICSGFERYPEVTLAQLKKMQPDYVFLSSEPFPFKQKHIKELKIELPETEIVLVDGEMFSWYGNRMLNAIKYFNELHARIS